ncbi:MAG TPA: hypothetical protein VFM14_09440 [Gemmatimonadales bacterium]|nr:hypothetical protein [Gemmatimonadales bacterium]
MSRAFINEDAGGEPARRYALPALDDPAYLAAAARALLQGANEGDSASAEAATGYVFGDPALIREVSAILAEARAHGNERLEQLAERYLRRAGR